MANFPVQHISFSSMRLFFENEYLWKCRYIDRLNVFKMNPAMIVGTMAHWVAERYFQGATIEDATSAMHIWFEQLLDSDINWWKTWSREKVLKDFNQAVTHFFQEMPDYTEIIGIEQEFKTEISDTIDWHLITSPLPFNGRTDIIYREKDQSVTIEDFKFRTSHTDVSEWIHPSMWIQAFFYYYGCAHLKPARIKFREVKIWANRDKSSQHNVITIEFSGEEFETRKAYFWYLLMLFVKRIEDADPDTVFIPNVFDMIRGADTEKVLMENVLWYKVDKPTSEFVTIEKDAIKDTKFIKRTEATTVEWKIVNKFQEFGIALSFSDSIEGFSYDQYRFIPSRGVKMSDIKSKVEDIAQAIENVNIRILAPIPWTKFVGVEIPRSERRFSKFDSKVTKLGEFPLGKDIHGHLHTFDLKDSNTCHLLVAGQSGSWKSEFLKVMISALPKDWLLACIDPKMVELTKFKKRSVMFGTRPDEALEILQSLEREMMARYQTMSDRWVNNIDDIGWRHFMLVIEEYANLVFSLYWKEIEATLVQLANLWRAAGIHVVIATQRPEVKVVSGMLKANIPFRVSFAVATQIDSKVILDSIGSEKLTGKWDMLAKIPGQELTRLQSLHL